MADQSEMMQVARERAEKAIDAAIGALHKAANDIGKEHGIPENVSGHSIDELLGRMSYVPSMARDLRQACGQVMAKQILTDFMEGTAPAKPAKAATPAPQKVEPSTLPANVPVGMDVGDLNGVTVQAVKALREAGYRSVGDLVNVPDEHLLKINGIAEKSLAQVRAAIAKASV